MRNFYLFYINDYFKDTYFEYPYKLYKMLEDAYLTNKYNLVSSANLYNQITKKINKLYTNEFLIANNKMKREYANTSNIHTFSSNREVTKLLVSNHCIKIKSNLNYPTFFDDINKYNNNIFICDFANNDYFWLHKVAHSVV